MPIAESHQWTVKHTPKFLANFPAELGVCAIGHTEAVYGLEVKHEYLYIGRTDNMRRRMREHSLEKGSNAKLKKYLYSEINRAKFWHVAGIEASESKTLEKRLIAKFNTVGKG